jgi:hypothetical protein
MTAVTETATVCFCDRNNLAIEAAKSKQSEGEGAGRGEKAQRVVAIISAAPQRAAGAGRVAAGYSDTAPNEKGPRTEQPGAKPHCTAPRSGALCFVQGKRNLRRGKPGGRSRVASYRDCEG